MFNKINAVSADFNKPIVIATEWLKYMHIFLNKMIVKKIVKTQKNIKMISFSYQMNQFYKIKTVHANQ